MNKIRLIVAVVFVALLGLFASRGVALAEAGTRPAALAWTISHEEDLDAVEACLAFGDYAAQLDTLMANPGTRPAAVAWTISQQESLDIVEPCAAAGDYAAQLGTLLANPGTRPAAIAWTISHKENLDDE